MEIKSNSLTYPDLTKWGNIVDDFSQESGRRPFFDIDLFNMTKEIATVRSLIEGSGDPAKHEVTLSNQTNERVILQYSVLNNDQEKEEIMEVDIKARSMSKTLILRRIINKLGMIFYFASEKRPVNRIIKDEDFVEDNPELPLPLRGRHRIASTIWELYLDNIEQEKDRYIWLSVNNSLNSLDKNYSTVIYPIPEKLLVH